MKESKKRGAPVKDANDKNVQRTLGMPPPIWEKVDERGGQAWIRKALKASKTPALPGFPKPKDPPAD